MIAFLLGSALALQSPWPIEMAVLPCKIAGRYLSCNAKVKGQEGAPVTARIVVSLSTTRSAFKADFLEKARAEEGRNFQLVLGGVEISPLVARITPALESMEDVDGVLGADAFQGLSVGFNFDTLQLAVWNPTKVANGLASWFEVEQDKRKPEAELKQLSYTRFSEKYASVPAISVQLNKQNVDMLISSSVGGTALATSVLDKYSPEWKDSKTFREAGVYLAANLTIGEIKIPWISLTPVEGFQIRGFESPVLGRLAMPSIRSTRYVVDFQGRRLITEKLQGGSLLEMSLSRTLNIPLRIDNGLLKLGTISRLSKESADQIQGAEIVYLADYRGTDIVMISSGRAKDWKSRMDDFTSKALKATQIFVNEAISRKYRAVKISDLTGIPR